MDNNSNKSNNDNNGTYGNYDNVVDNNVTVRDMIAKQME